MKKLLLLSKALFKKEYILMKRYLFNSLGSFITLYIVFLLIFAGYKGLVGNSPNFGTFLEGLVVGYTLWILSMSVYQDITYTIQREAREGTLEQLYMSSHNFGVIMTINVVVKTIFSMIMVVFILGLLMATTGKYLNLDILSLLVLLILTLLGILGLGFVFGGLTLVFKRIDTYLQILTFGLIGLVAAPVDKVPMFKLLPASWGALMIEDVMVDGISLFDLPVGDVLFMGAVGLAYALIGYGIYKLCEKKAMDRGMLGHY